jgi:hypothetical protein
MFKYYFFHLSNICNVSCPCDPSPFAHSNSIWWCLQVMTNYYLMRSLLLLLLFWDQVFTSAVCS